MKQIPAPLYRKILMTALAGGGCMLFGLIYYITMKDRVLLFLSAALFINCAWQAFSIYRTAKKEEYEIIEGTCVRINPQLVGKFRTVCMMDDAGAETTLRLTKSCKLKIGERYRLYLDNRNQFRTGNGFIDKTLATGNFLGYEPVQAAVESLENHKESE